MLKMTVKKFEQDTNIWQNKSKAEPKKHINKEIQVIYIEELTWGVKIQMLMILRSSDQNQLWKMLIK